MEFNLAIRLKIRFNQFRYHSQTSIPFLSGDAFKNLCDIVIEEKRDLGKANLFHEKDKLVFCKSELLEDLLESMPKSSQIKCLIAGNSDRDFGYEIDGLLKRVQKTFLQNSLISNNESVFTLPIGLENLRLGINGIPRNLAPSSPFSEKKDMVLVGPFSASHSSRVNFLDSEEYARPPFTRVANFMSPRNYSELARSYKYVLCPRGNGIDTHRFWETLYRGSIPIVERSEWSQSLRKHDLPFIEIETLSPEKIVSKLEEANNSSAFEDFSPRSVEALWIDYWERLFRK